MSSNNATAKLTALSALLQANQDLFHLSNMRRLVFAGNVQVIEEKLRQIGVQYESDVDGVLLDVSGIVPGYSIVWHEWLDQELGIANVYDKTVVLNLSGDFFAITEAGAIVEFFGPDAYHIELEGVILYYRMLAALTSDMFPDHHNEAKKEIVLYSSTKGVMKVGYEAVAPRVTSKYSDNYIKSLMELIGIPAYKVFFINGLFKISGDKPSIELTTIILRAEDLELIVKRDYELALKQFDFERFKDHLLKEKDRYFTSIRDILNKVFGQLIGVPLSISASVFATYRVEGDVFTISLIGLGFLFYVFLYVKIQNTYKKDVRDIDTDFERDFEIIKNKSGLQAEMILKERSKIKVKINQTLSMISFLTVGIVVLGVTFLIYLAYQVLGQELWYFLEILWIVIRSGMPLL